MMFNYHRSIVSFNWVVFKEGDPVQSNISRIYHPFETGLFHIIVDHWGPGIKNRGFDKYFAKCKQIKINHLLFWVVMKPVELKEHCLNYQHSVLIINQLIKKGKQPFFTGYFLQCDTGIWKSWILKTNLVFNISFVIKCTSITWTLFIFQSYQISI